MLHEILGMEKSETPVEVVDVPPKKLSPFDFVSSISYTKENLIEQSPDNLKQYNAFVINRALSFGADTVLYANEMNRYPHLDRDIQYDFLRSSIRKKKRYDSWQKAEKESDDLTLIKEYYGYSNEKAKQALTLLSDDNIDDLRKRLFKGGIEGKGKTRGRK